jgi:predicted small secreted protein
MEVAMLKLISLISTFLMGSILLSGCANQQGINKQQGGTLLGGAAGALIGSQIGHGAGRVVGAGIAGALGAFAGSEIGKSMDRQDAQYSRDRRHYQDYPDKRYDQRDARGGDQRDARGGDQRDARGGDQRDARRGDQRDARGDDQRDARGDDDNPRYDDRGYYRVSQPLRHPYYYDY